MREWITRFVLFGDEFELHQNNIKDQWLQDYRYKTYYWEQWLTFDLSNEISGERYKMPTVEQMADWMILRRSYETRETRMCLNPRAFCWSTGKSLFLRPATVVKTKIEGPGEPCLEQYYFSPGEYTLWLLRKT